MIFIDARKAQVFVAHIQQHLDNKEQYNQNPERQIPRGKVGCKICNLSIDRIYTEYRKRRGWASR